MAAPTTTSDECCMCGDHGLSEELLPCKICHFRYCSNLYPKAKSYRVCNWCLAQSQDGSPTKEKSKKLSKPSLSRKNGARGEESNKKSKKRNNNGRKIGCHDDHGEPKGGLTKSLQFPRAKKHKKLPERLAPTARKRIVTNGDTEEKCGTGIRKRAVLRSNRVVRRYKLLDEVSS
ncbi:uncharacterized protein LOC115739537 isoform X2 [Rhodamnia argentea]|uniref:Uncharacterized protein LOC115739537 isoform X2 n=1 Tax=Rhodamnia argentea TaxID=178133 RepID=A0A8B8P183_9MYRT|nr:uncharacterized protein LOC115739537 isoform X2 [Rhodamnia argentea]